MRDMMWESGVAERLASNLTATHRAAASSDCAMSSSRRRAARSSLERRRYTRLAGEGGVWGGGGVRAARGVEGERG